MIETEEKQPKRNDTNYFEWERNLAIRVYESHSRKSQILFFKLVTTFGSPGLWWTFMTVFLFHGIFLDNWYEYASLSGAYLYTMVPYFIIKAVVKRERPYKVLDEISPRGMPEKGYSFPSGHSTFGALMYVYIGMFFFSGGLTLIPLFAIATYIGYTRMVLGVHYLSDVVCGVIFGFISGILYYYFFQASWIQFVYAVF